MRNSRPKVGQSSTDNQSSLKDFAIQDVSLNEGPSSAILTLNGGSSSIKFALFDGVANPVLILAGRVKEIRSQHPEFSYKTSNGKG
jgi:hypothetical protein